MTGAGTLKTLKIIQKKVTKFKIKKFKFRKKVYDWNIPDEWNVIGAYVKDKYGKKIIDFNENNLHLVGYSTPFKKIRKKEL